MGELHYDLLPQGLAKDNVIVSLEGSNKRLPFRDGPRPGNPKRCLSHWALALTLSACPPWRSCSDRLGDTGKHQPGDILDVWSLGKHVDRLHLSNAEPILHQESQVAGQTGRMTRDIDQRARLQGGNGRKDLRGATGSRGVDHHGPRFYRQQEFIAENLFDISGDELAVAEAVHTGVRLGMAHRFGDGFNAKHLVGMSCQVQADAPDSAVKIERRLTGPQIAPVTDQSIDACGLGVMDLQK